MALELGTISGSLELEDKFTPELEKALGVTAQALEDVRQEMEQAAAKGQEVDTALKQLGVTYEEYFATLKKQSDAQAEASAEMDKMQQEALKMNAALGESTNSVGHFLEALMHGNIKEAAEAFVEMPAALLAIGAAAYEAFEAIDKLATAAQQLHNKGLTLGMTAEGVQALDRLAEHAGVSTRAVEMSLVRMQRAAENNTKAFQALKLDPEDFFAANTADQLKMVSERIMELGTASERSAAATNLLGRGAAMQLLPVFEELNEHGYPKMIALTNEQVDSLFELKMAIHESEGAWTDLGNQFVAMLAEFPGIKDGIIGIGHVLSDVALFIRDKMIPAIQEFKSQWLEVFAAINASSAENSAKIVQNLQAMKTQGLSIKDVLASGKIGGTGIDNQMAGLLEGANAQGKSIDELIKKYSDAAKGAQDLAAANLKAADDMRFHTSAVEDSTGKHGANAKAVAEAEKAWEKYDKALQSAVEKGTAAFEKHHKEMALLILDWDKMKRAQEAAADATGFVMPKLPELGTGDKGIGATGTSGLGMANAAKMFEQGFSAETIHKKLMSGLQLSSADAEAILAALHHKLGEKSFGQALATSLQDAFKKLPDVIIGAIQGGGNIGKAVGASLGGDIAGDMFKEGSKGLTFLTDKLGGTLGKTVGSFMGPLGSMAGSLIGGLVGKGIGKIQSALGIGGNKEIMALNDTRDKFFESMGGFEELQKKLVGLTDQDLVKKIFDAKTVDQFNAAVNETMSLIDSQAQAQQALDDAVERYGFTIEELGPKFAQQKMDEQAGQLIQDFEILKAAGIDVNTIIAKMGPSLVEFVNTSIAAGTTVPEAMRPVIEQLIASGQLLDENGEAYTSVEDAGITFAQTMDEKFTTLIDKITQMVNALLGIPTNVDTNVNVHTNYSSSGDPGNNDGGRRNAWPGEGNALGGIVTSPTISALGERGPEAIVPLSDMSSLGGGKSQEDWQNSLLEFGQRQTRSITKGVRDALLQSGR